MSQIPSTQELLEASHADRQQEQVLSCDICKRQDETVRIVSYPFILSLVIVTYRRAFAGVWCQRHRRRLLLYASLITATLGWLGIPFGLLCTPGTLLKLARAGDQPAAANANLLRAIADRKINDGDSAGAVKCLEQSLRFQDDSSTRARVASLRSLHTISVPPHGCLASTATVLGVLIGGALIGAAIAIIDSLWTIIWSPLFGNETLMFLVLLSWAPFIALSFVGGIALFSLVEAAVARLRLTSRSLAIALAVTTSVIAAYGILQGDAMIAYIFALIGGGVFATPADAIVGAIGVLLMGGAFYLQAIVQPVSTTEAIYSVLFGIVVIYFIVSAWRTASLTATWQERLAN